MTACVRPECGHEGSDHPLGAPCSLCNCSGFRIYRESTEGWQKWEDFIKRVTYKPGWKIGYVYEIGLDEHRIVVDMHTQDSTTEEFKLVRVAQWAILPDWMNEGHAGVFVRDMIQKLEMHELDEWFKVDGELVNDPHWFEKKYEERIGS